MKPLRTVAALPKPHYGPAPAQLDIIHKACDLRGEVNDLRDKVCD